MTELRLAQVILQPHMTVAVQIAAVSEGGIIHNDHYNAEEYVKRRTYYLGSQPEWRQRVFGLFSTARREAEAIFD